MNRPVNAHWTRRNRWFLLVFLFFGAGCADTVGIATQQDLSQLRDEVSQLRRDLSALTLSLNRGRAEADTRATQVERQSRDQQAEIQRQLALLQSRTDALTADVTRVSRQLAELSQELKNPRQNPAAAPSTPPTSATPSPRPLQQTGGAEPRDVYQAAYLDFSKGNYRLAIEAFRELIRRFPDSDLADQAQHLIGEAYFSQASRYATQGESEKAETAFEQAVQEFRKVIVNYPQGEKVPSALYKEALALLALKRQTLARARLQYLVDHFPQSEEAPLAQERLAALKDSGVQ